jgi:hypothetical protein
MGETMQEYTTTAVGVRWLLRVSLELGLCIQLHPGYNSEDVDSLNDAFDNHVFTPIQQLCDPMGSYVMGGSRQKMLQDTAKDAGRTKQMLQDFATIAQVVDKDVVQAVMSHLRHREACRRTSWLLAFLAAFQEFSKTLVSTMHAMSVAFPGTFAMGTGKVKEEERTSWMQKRRSEFKKKTQTPVQDRKEIDRLEGVKKAAFYNRRRQDGHTLPGSARSLDGMVSTESVVTRNAYVSLRKYLAHVAMVGLDLRTFVQHNSPEVDNYPRSEVANILSQQPSSELSERKRIYSTYYVGKDKYWEYASLIVFFASLPRYRDDNSYRNMLHIKRRREKVLVTVLGQGQEEFERFFGFQETSPQKFLDFFRVSPEKLFELVRLTFKVGTIIPSLFPPVVMADGQLRSIQSDSLHQIEAAFQSLCPKVLWKSVEASVTMQFETESPHYIMPYFNKDALKEDLITVRLQKTHEPVGPGPLADIQLLIPSTYEVVMPSVDNRLRFGLFDIHDARVLQMFLHSAEGVSDPLVFVNDGDNVAVWMRRLVRRLNSYIGRVAAEKRLKAERDGDMGELDFEPVEVAVPFIPLWSFGLCRRGGDVKQAEKALFNMSLHADNYEQTGPFLEVLKQLVITTNAARTEAEEENDHSDDDEEPMGGGGSGAAADEHARTPEDLGGRSRVRQQWQQFRRHPLAMLI